MLYIVECSFTDPAREAEWNAYYSGPKLDSVLAVPGFRTSQRFRAVDGERCPYLAVHTVDGPQVLSGTSYKSGGGGSFGEWQPYISDWARNLFDGCDVAPDVAADEVLLLTDRPRAELQVGDVPVTWLVAAGLDRSTPQRGIACVPRERIAALGAAVREFRLYEPMMARRREPDGKTERSGD